MAEMCATNSLEWWNDYFISQWEANHGREQTRYFMNTLLDHLAFRESQWLSSYSRTILDWGCALGDGVDVIKHRHPAAGVTGLDFSRTAVEKARKLYPEHKFLLSGGRIPLDYDVVVTSNCLEHYENPLDIIADHLKHSRFLYILMVPFEEEHLHETHVSRFDMHSFPGEIGGFKRVGSAIFTASPRHWNGEQIMVRYASPAYLQLAG